MSWAGLEEADSLTLAGKWLDACEECGVVRTKRRRARAYWIGLGSQTEVLRAGLIAYRDSPNPADQERALLGIVEQYDRDVAEQAKR